MFSTMAQALAYWAMSVRPNSDGPNSPAAKLVWMMSTFAMGYLKDSIFVSIRAKLAFMLLNVSRMLESRDLDKSSILTIALA